jgi:hypothetical protein
MGIKIIKYKFHNNFNLMLTFKVIHLMSNYFKFLLIYIKNKSFKLLKIANNK